MLLNKEYDFDSNKYEKLLQAVASMSRLYGDTDKAFIHSRFIEKLYVYCTGAINLAKKDKSFDALLGNDIGVGIKTFIANQNTKTKTEKVAEFTKNASLGDFDSLHHFDKTQKIAMLRNTRIVSDAGEYGIDINKSIYHCLVRTEKGAIIHEEPYACINIDKIKPTDRYGNEIPNFPDGDIGHTYFKNDCSNYSYNKAKNVLYKYFRLSEFANSKIIEFKIYDDIFDRIITWNNFELGKLQETSSKRAEKRNLSEFVILPLYSTKNLDKPEVPPKSGINQWNAGGRERKFGEAYIPIPSLIHKKHPNFFPDKDEKFIIKLPDGKTISAKVCQDGSKALMADPNTELCNWLYSMIDLKKEAINSRFAKNQAYTYEDLKKIGKDSVKVIRVKDEKHRYEIESTKLGSYQDFIEEVE